MDYPLGTFPRYGHQIRRAAERRERAIHNSIVTRQAQAHYYLRAEAAFYNFIIEYTNSLEAKSPGGQVFIDELNSRLLRVKQKLEQGQRVYFRRLGIILRDVAVRTGTCREIHDFDDKQLADLAHNMAIRQLENDSDP